VFVYERETGKISRVSVDSNGKEADFSSFIPTISANGRYIAFHSLATNLSQGDSNNERDVFVHDRVTGKTARISTGIDGLVGNGRSFEAQISANGRFISFASDATNLVPGDINFNRDIFVAQNPLFVLPTRDFNNDGNTDLLWYNFITGETAFWGMNGTDYFQAHNWGAESVAGGWRPVAAGDFTGTGSTDILWRNFITGDNVFWNMNGSTIANVSFTAPVGINEGWDVAGVGDFTSDGKADILWRSRFSGDNAIWEMNGSTIANVHFTTAVNINDGWDVTGVGDLTNDGKADILWRHRVTGDNALWEMNGTAIAGVAMLENVAPATGWNLVGMGDFTKDGRTDILWRNSLDGQMAVWGMNGSAITGVSMITPIVAPSSGWNVV